MLLNEVTQLVTKFAIHHGTSCLITFIMAPHVSLCCAQFLLLLMQYLIQLIAPVAIKGYLLFCDTPSTNFGIDRPSLGRSFTKELYTLCLGFVILCVFCCY